MKTKQFLAALLSSALVLGTMAAPALAEGDAAMIGGTGYETLDAAISAARNDETIKLVSDITESDFSGDHITIASGKNITLDLNGCTLSGTTAAKTNTSLIKNEGALTIADSSNAGDGMIESRATNPDMTKTFSYVNNAISNYGRLTINGGTVKTADSINSNNIEQAQFAVDNYAGSTFILNGGTVTTDLANNYAVRAYGSETTTNNKINIEINGGTISGNEGLKLHCPDRDVNSYIDVNITGGEITASRSIYANYQNNAYDGGYLVGTMNISGGTIEKLTFKPSTNGVTTLNISGTATLNSVDAYRTIVNVSGGTISTLSTKADDLSISGGTITKWDRSQGSNNSETITGGTFNNKEMQTYLNPGYAEVLDPVAPQSDQDDLYTIIRFKDFKNYLGDAITIKTATENGKYEQITTAAVEISEINNGKAFHLAAYDATGNTVTAISGKTITLSGISTNTSGEGSVICGLIITDIPAGYTVRLE